MFEGSPVRTAPPDEEFISKRRVVKWTLILGPGVKLENGRSV